MDPYNGSYHTNYILNVFCILISYSNLTLNEENVFKIVKVTTYLMLKIYGEWM